MCYVGAWPESKVREISFRRSISCTTTSRYMQRYRKVFPGPKLDMIEYDSYCMRFQYRLRLSFYKWYDQKILWCFAGFTTACTIWWYLFWTFSKWTSIYACKYLLVKKAMKSHMIWPISKRPFTKWRWIKIKTLEINKWIQLRKIRVATSMWI